MSKAGMPGQTRDPAGYGAPSLRQAWLVSSSRLAILCAGAGVAALLASASPADARSPGGAWAVSATSAATAAATEAAAQAAAAAAQGSASLKRATVAIQAIQAAQAAARAAATTANGVPNGLTLGGLVPDSGLAANGAANPVTTWTGAATPSQTTSGDRVNVTVRQTAPQAILNWSSFNVGAHTSLIYDQQGNDTWVALNRVTGAIAPSQILGNVKADGGVYVINQNGIVFGSGSQINVGGLIASSAAITDSQFLNYGIYSTKTNNLYIPTFTAAGAQVVVEPGALITTAPPGTLTSGGGSVMLLGTEVHNAGTITTPNGQTILAAGDSFVLRPGVSTTDNKTSTTSGVELAPLLASGSRNGTVDNAGLVFAQQGDITLAGHQVIQDGVLVSTTSVNQRGTIHLLNSASDRTGSVTITGQALTAILPEFDSTDTALDSRRDTLIAGSSGVKAPDTTNTQFDNLSLMADRADQSRIEIVSGGLVTFKAGSLTMAQGGQIAASTPKQIAVETQATLDVSGTTGTVLPASANNIEVNVQGNELRDSPVNRDSGVLVNRNVWIDARDLVLVPAGTGGDASDRYYTPGGLLEVSGYLANTAHTVGEWTAVGGTITLAADKVTAEKGSLINLSGGMVTYDAGYILSTNVRGADGRIYSIADAPTDLSIVGYAGDFRRDHAHWGVTEIWSNPFGRGSTRAVWQDGYSVGRDAGVLQVYAVTSDVEANIDAEVYTGQRQTVARPSDTTDGYKLGQTQVALPGRLSVAAFDFIFGTVVATSSVFVDPTGEAVSSTGQVFDSRTLSAVGLGGLSVLGGADVRGDLTLAPGGIMKLSGPVHLSGNLTARGGSISLGAANSDVTLDPGSVIDTRGLWTNVALDAADVAGTVFRNGGAITISAANLVISAGVEIDASAGGAILANGKFSGGNGGDISLTGTTSLLLDGSVASNGFGKGGKLTLASGGAIVVGDQPLQANGTLQQGETAPVLLALSSPLTLTAGSIAPFPVTVTASSIENGQAVPTGARPNVQGVTLLIVGSAGWTVPAGITYVTDTAGTFYPVGAPVPAGTSLFYVIGTFSSGYVLPANSFTTALPIYPTEMQIAAGARLPVDAVLAKGYVLPVGTVLPQTVAVTPVLALDASFFQAGFSSYDISGGLGVTVQPGVKIDVAEPVYPIPTALFALPTGSDPRTATSLRLPPLFTEDAAHRKLTQRAGADLVLESPQLPATQVDSTYEHLGAPITIGEGAAITVDAGRSVSLKSSDQITILGSITAPGGSISAVNTAQMGTISNQNPYVESGRSVWIGDDAVLDVSGLVDVATDRSGLRYGTVTDGGSIILGANSQPGATGISGGNAYVVIRQGARLDASGTSATLDLPGQGPTLVASNGGSISLATQWGFVIDGSLRSERGGLGASSGALSLILDSSAVVYNYDVLFSDIPAAAKAGRVITVTQDTVPSGIATNLAPGELAPGLVMGSGRISAAQVSAGGFDSLSLWGRSAIAFDGNVSLSLGRSLVLHQGTITNTQATGEVALAAPYVLFDGHTLQYSAPGNSFVPDVLPTYPKGAIFSVSGDLVDIRNQVYVTYQKVNVSSSGDLRFLAATDRPASGARSMISVLAASGDLALTAAQIYPASGATAIAAAGITETTYSDGSEELLYGSAGSTLTVAGTGVVPDLPYSVFGSLTLTADTVLQGGVVRAPLGSIKIGDAGFTATSSKPTGRIELLPGSITSVSANGLVMPYGGTSDGVTYQVDGGAAVTPSLITDAFTPSGSFVSTLNVGVTLNGVSVQGDAGSLIDVSGGGVLSGAAFVSGRGGSVDPLLTALANANPGHKFSTATSSVYAIVPGTVTAPVAGGYTTAWTGAVPTIGQQITVPGGVPGLPAGTYTLLPANYALLPGAFRVELGAKSELATAAVGLANGSYVLTGWQGVANTGIKDALATKLVITPGASVRRYGQFNEQSYASFVLANAAQFGTRRTLIEADAKMLSIYLSPSATTAASAALRFDGETDFSAGVGGFDGSLVLTGKGDLVITNPGSTTANTATRTTVSAAAIAGIDAPNLVLGMPLTDSSSFVDFGYDVNNVATNVTLEAGVRLTGSQVILVANNSVTLEAGAVIDTLGRGFSGLDSTSGLAFGHPAWGIAAPALLVVSNGSILLNTPAGVGTSKIVMKDGSALYSEGTIGFYSDAGLQTSGSIKIGTRNLALSVSAFNIGAAASLAAVPTLPAGLNFDQGFIDMLLAGGGVAGAPSVERLVLAAGQSINFFGSADLSTFDPVTGKSRLQELVLQSSAIYGYGAATDQVHLATDTLVWAGNSVYDAAGTTDVNIPAFRSATPGARLTGLGNSGAFTVDARQVVLGYPTQSQPNSNVIFNRLMLGFDHVSFNATERFTANNKGTVSVYASGPAVGTTFDAASYQGVGGTLTFNTPLMTGDAAANLAVYGGAVTIASNGAAIDLAGGLGATLAVTADTLRVDTTVLLPGGALTLTARHDLVIDSHARLDLSGHAVALGDTVRQVWGGNLTLASLNGNIAQLAGSSIDLSSDGSDAGALKVDAVGAVRLGGSLRATGGGNGALDGAFDLTADSLGGSDLTGDFALLNRQLTEAGFTYSRAFSFGSGDLAVGSDVRARNVSITANGGSLTVDGRIDASGTGTGAIRLAARGDVAIAGGAVLDVHGTQLVVDSNLQPIEASNRNSIEINTSQGWIRLATGATLDTSSPDGVARGHVDINARRADETGGDVKIDASSGPLSLHGIGSLAVNGYWTYSPTDANGTIVQNTTDTAAPAGAVGLNQIDAQNKIFYANALANSLLQGRLAGLQAAGAAYHFRPGVEIVSSAASGGKLTVQGDLDLSGYRYGPTADRNPTSATYGFGEPLAFTIRASGDLNIKGSITDGFGVPKTSPDENAFRDRIKNGTTVVVPGGTAPYSYYKPTKDLTLATDWVVPGSYYTVYTDRGYFNSGQTVPAGTSVIFTSWNTYVYFMIGDAIPDSVVQTILPQGKIYAIAPMLAPGAMSASIRLVSGADLASADSRALLSVSDLGSAGNMTLDDYHTHTPTNIGYDNRPTEIPSVIRTGTGDLELLAGGSMTEKSLYGIYTAGTQSDLATDNSGYYLKYPTSQLPTGTGLESTFNTRVSYYPDHGGDLRVTVQGDLSGYASPDTTWGDGGAWLLRQGAPELGLPTAWSINFGSYMQGNATPIMVAGPTGFGTFGGGNATVIVGGDAGGIASSNPYASNVVTTGLVVSVGATGRVLSHGTLVETGGGDINVEVAGRLNALSTGGLITDLRGNATVEAAEIGAVRKVYNSPLSGDPRAANIYGSSKLASEILGPSFSLGDASVTVRTLGTAVLGDIRDPGIAEGSTDAMGNSFAGAAAGSILTSWFTLWQPSTSLDVVALGGDLVPMFAPKNTVDLPPVFTAAALSGNIYMMNMPFSSIADANHIQAPSPLAQFELLAGGSIYDGLTTISMSAANPALLPTPFHPAYSYTSGVTVVSNFTNWGLFAFGANQATGDLHAGDPNPVRIYAVEGDIVGLSLSTAKRLDMMAGGDIVMTTAISGANAASKLSITHADATDVSTITAGGDVVYPRITINGPGGLAVTAGGDIYLGDKGSIVSNGPAYAGDIRLGASIALTAGVGSSQADYAAVAALYLDPANLAVSGTPLADQPGKIAKTYENELIAWLKQRYGYTGGGAGARAYFASLGQQQQDIFLRQVYFAELRAGGREHNDTSSPRYGSYMRGREMIATLFPADRTYDGSIVMFGAAGVRTVAGGDITLLTPGGRQVIGVEGAVPPASAGLITQGQGDISTYSQGSILLGLSRIMTSFGGDIIAWSAEGDINAGRGAKTTVIYVPPKRVYDKYGNVTLSPQAPSTGAGIATLNPVPSVPPGDVDLIAPLGTIDAGEAGIRSSGNVNLAALQIVNAANIQAQGTVTGVPTVQAPPVTALTSASNSTAATQQAQLPAARDNDRPSIIMVEVLGFGGGGGDSTPTPDDDNRKRGQRSDNALPAYDSTSPVKILGVGPLRDDEKRSLTDEEKRKL